MQPIDSWPDAGMASSAQRTAIAGLVCRDAFLGAAFLAGAPGGGHGIVDDPSDFFRGVVVIDPEAAVFLFDLADLYGRVGMGRIVGVDGRCDGFDERPPSFTTLPGHFFDDADHLREPLLFRWAMASTDIIVRPIMCPLRASSFIGLSTG